MFSKARLGFAVTRSLNRAAFSTLVTRNTRTILQRNAVVNQSCAVVSVIFISKKKKKKEEKKLKKLK